MPSYSVSCKVFMQSEMSKNASTITEDYYEKQYVWHCKLLRVHKNRQDTMTRKFFVTVMSVFTTLSPTLPTRSRPVSRCKAHHRNGNHSICFSCKLNVCVDLLGLTHPTPTTPTQCVHLLESQEMSWICLEMKRNCHLCWSHSKRLNASSFITLLI